MGNWKLYYRRGSWSLEMARAWAFKVGRFDRWTEAQIPCTASKWPRLIVDNVSRPRISSGRTILWEFIISKALAGVIGVSFEVHLTLTASLPVGSLPIWR